jgi:hypothetical protein
VISNNIGNTTTDVVTLTVTDTAITPAITTQPASRTVNTAQTATFTVAASGSPTPTLQWQSSSNGSPWTNLANTAPYSGVTTGTLAIITPATALNGTQCRCIATNFASGATSNAATLTVTSDPATAAAQHSKPSLNPPARRPLP